MTKIGFFLTSILLKIQTVKAEGPLSSDAMDNMTDAVESTAGTAGFESSVNIGSILATLIKGFLGLLGIIFIILIILAGYNYMTAQGHEEKIKKATTTIWQAIIGLMIIIAAYSITYFVFKYMPWGETS